MRDFYRLFNAVSGLLLYYDNLKDFEVAYRYVSEDIRDTYHLQLITESEYRRLKQSIYVILTGVTELRKVGLGPSKLNEIFIDEHWKEVESDV